MFPIIMKIFCVLLTFLYLCTLKLKWRNASEATKTALNAILHKNDENKKQLNNGSNYRQRQNP